MDIAGDPDPDVIALSIQQPWAELILRGIKTVEVRRVAARPQGPVYLYASQRFSSLPGVDQLLASHGISPETLPRGVIVGTVDVLECRRARPQDAPLAQVSADLLTETFAWVLGNARRLPQPVSPRFIPFGTWFYPFKRLRTNVRQRRGRGQG